MCVSTDVKCVYVCLYERHVCIHLIHMYIQQSEENILSSPLTLLWTNFYDVKYIVQNFPPFNWT